MSKKKTKKVTEPIELYNKTSPAVGRPFGPGRIARLRDMLWHTFSWDSTKQGFNYWDDVYDQLNQVYQQAKTEKENK